MFKREHKSVPSVLLSSVKKKYLNWMMPFLSQFIKDGTNNIKKKLNKITMLFSGTGMKSRNH